MVAHDNLNPDQFHYVHTPMQGTTYPNVKAYHGEKEIGHLGWAAGHPFPFDLVNGEVTGVEVHPDYRRRGVATEMFHRAKQADPLVRHSENQTEDGAEWSASHGRR